jgi:putative ABC transport system permease protein
VRARAYRIIGADYFATLGLRMVQGREFTPAEERSPAAPRVAIVDEAFARQVFAERNPIGKLIRLAPSPDDVASLPGEPMEIVGVAAPLREELLDRAPVPHAYVPFGREERALMHVLVRVAPGRDAAAALEDVRLALRAAEPGLPVLTLSTLQAFHDRSPELRALGLGARVFAGLAGVAVLIAAIGDGALLAGAGATIGVPLAILVSVALRSVFVEVGGFDAVVVGVSTAILVSAAAIAALVPARRATRVQPLTALRGE